MLFIAMRASAHKSARRHLAASKRSIVMVVAGMALILGTTSVGASMFGNKNDTLLRERAANRPLSTSKDGQTSEDLNSSDANPLDGQGILVPDNTPTTPPSKKTESNNTTANNTTNNQPADNTPPASDPNAGATTPDPGPTDPGTTDPGTGGTPTDPGPTDPGTGGGSQDNTNPPPNDPSATQ